jgi:hypothetical protein
LVLLLSSSLLFRRAVAHHDAPVERGAAAARDYEGAAADLERGARQWIAAIAAE